MSVSRPFTTMALDSERDLLRNLRSRLQSGGLASREHFADLMATAFGHGRLDARALSDDMGYNFSTVHRWIDGKTAPHPGMWPRIVEWVIRATTARIESTIRSETEHPHAGPT